MFTWPYLIFLFTLLIIGVFYTQLLFETTWRPQRRVLFWVTGYLPVRFIKEGDRAYLERYYLGTLFSTPTTDSKIWGFLRDKGQQGTVFTPFSYPGGKKDPQWWLKAPKGRNSERQAY
jgi:hypothetical protein